MQIKVTCAQTGQVLKFCPLHEGGTYPHINVEGQGSVYFVDPVARDAWMERNLRMVRGSYVVNRDGSYVPRLSALG